MSTKNTPVSPLTPEARRALAGSIKEFSTEWIQREQEYRVAEEVRVDLEAQVTADAWFVDPPYEGVPYYRTNTVVHQDLAAWCQTRQGLVVVCEREGAAWLPFEPLVTITICGKLSSKECIYTRRTTQAPNPLEAFG